VERKDMERRRGGFFGYDSESSDSEAGKLIRFLKSEGVLEGV